MTAWVCDWTHWQEVPCPARGIADEGYSMVKLKVGGAITEGRFFEDPMFFNSAIPLLNTPELIPAAFWYLVPGRARAQAALMYDLLDLVDLPSWAVFLDVEQPGLNWRDVLNFRDTWHQLTGGQQLNLYTRRAVWLALGAPVGAGKPAFPILEEARWVNDLWRRGGMTRYASEQAKGINPDSWKVNYGGWEEADLLQFTDYALVQGKRVSASMFRGTKAELRELVL
jgi:hypothetical protein